MISDGHAHSALKGVIVRVSGPGGSVRAVSDRTGFFVVLGILPGIYVIGLETPGYYSLRCLQVGEPAKQLSSLVDANATADVYDVQ